jgi:hypothetical protein
MSEQAWTKEPWEIGIDIDTNLRLRHNCLVQGTGWPFHLPVASTYYPYIADVDQCEANALRIVDCVNALAGIPNPADFVRAARELADIADGTIAFAANDLAALPALTKAVKAFRAAGGAK